MVHFKNFGIFYLQFKPCGHLLISLKRFQKMKTNKLSFSLSAPSITVPNILPFYAQKITTLEL